jgi:hypothetical protein
MQTKILLPSSEKTWRGCNAVVAVEYNRGCYNLFYNRITTAVGFNRITTALQPRLNSTALQPHYNRG